MNINNINKISEYLSKDTDHLITKKTRLDGLNTIEADELDIFYIDKGVLVLITKRGMNITLDLNKFIVCEKGETLTIYSYSTYISIQPINKKYPNLRAEIERHNLSYRLINTVIEHEETCIQDILMRNEEINLSTAICLRDSLFPNKTIEYLFA